MLSSRRAGAPPRFEPTTSVNEEFEPLEKIDCRRHPGRPGPALPRPPFRSPLGERIRREICTDCWRDWLQHQTLLINHYGLDPRKAEAREFLYGQVKAVLFGEGEAAEIDTSKQGTIGAPEA